MRGKGLYVKSWGAFSEKKPEHLPSSESAPPCTVWRCSHQLHLRAEAQLDRQGVLAFFLAAISPWAPWHEPFLCTRWWPEWAVRWELHPNTEYSRGLGAPHTNCSCMPSDGLPVQCVSELHPNTKYLQFWGKIWLMSSKEMNLNPLKEATALVSQKGWKHKGLEAYIWRKWGLWLRSPHQPHASRL